jgi:hypothetical protein
MDVKKNEYVVVRRIEHYFADIDFDEFGDCVRGYRNAGYILHGEMQISTKSTELQSAECIIAQVLIAPATALSRDDKSELDKLQQFVVDMNSCKYEADKMLILLEKEYQRNNGIYRLIKPFDCN